MVSKWYASIPEIITIIHTLIALIKEKVNILESE